MTARFLLGVGGTGAKCVEAFMRLAACGLGPDAAWVGMLDQDRSNGNADRTARVLAEYAEVRGAWRAPGTVDLGESPLLRMRLEKPGAGWAWAPEERTSTTLSASIGYPALPAQEQAMVDALFSGEERRLQLDEGFRQRPALGAALTLQGVTPDSPVWRDLLTALQAAGHGGEVRVFLVASIFGGTGASGFPTVARLLRAEIARLGLGSTVKLGGALVLPYFSFPPPPGGSPAIRPDSAAFMLQARGALEYYAQLFQSEQVFDRLYVLGNDPLIPVNTYSVGGSTQANPPMLPELVAALAVTDFFGSTRIEPETVAAGTGGTDVGWDDLPFDSPGGPAGLRAAVAAALRTAVAWNQLYAPALVGGPRHASVREAWRRRLLARSSGVPASDEAVQRAVRLASTALAGLLQWFVALNRAGAGGTRKLMLLDDALVARDWQGNAPGEVQLVDAMSSTAFGRMVPGGGPSFEDVFHRLTYGPVPPAGAGVGRALAALYAACSTAGKA